MMDLLERGVCILAGASLIMLGLYFQRSMPTVGAVGEAVSIGGRFYPTALVLWLMWLLTIPTSGAFLVRGLRQGAK
jgi:hypothetical protein